MEVVSGTNREVSSNQMSFSMMSTLLRRSTRLPLRLYSTGRQTTQINKEGDRIGKEVAGDGHRGIYAFGVGVLVIGLGTYVYFVRKEDKEKERSFEKQMDAIKDRNDATIAERRK